MNNIEMFKNVLSDVSSLNYHEFNGKDLEYYGINDEDLSLLDLYFREIVKYPLLTKEQEFELGKKLKLKDKIRILTSLKSVKDSLIIDLESVFVSITNEVVKDYVLEKLKYYYDNNQKQDAVATKVVKRYLDEYQKLCERSVSGVPTVSELNDYFKDSNGEFVNFDVEKKMSFTEMIEQIDMFLQYMVARDLLINCNLRLVVKFAKTQVTSRMSYLDCVEEGNLGLIRAVDGFDVDRGCKFSTYASDWILQYIQRGKENKEMSIRIPSYVHSLKKKIERVEVIYFTETGKFPTVEYLSEVLNLEPSMIDEIKRIFYNNNCSSLDIKIGDNEEDTIGDFILDESSSSDIDDWIEQVSEDKLIDEFMASLTDREQEVIKYRFGFYEEGTSLTLEEIGKKFGVTRERIRQIEEKALKKMKTRNREIEGSRRYKSYR